MESRPPSSPVDAVLTSRNGVAAVPLSRTTRIVPSRSTTKRRIASPGGAVRNVGAANVPAGCSTTAPCAEPAVAARARSARSSDGAGRNLECAGTVPSSAEELHRVPAGRAGRPVLAYARRCRTIGGRGRRALAGGHDLGPQPHGGAERRRALAEDALRDGAEAHPQRGFAAGGTSPCPRAKVTGVVRRSRFGRRPSARPVAALTDAVTTQVAAALALAARRRSPTAARRRAAAARVPRTPPAGAPGRAGGPGGGGGVVGRHRGRRAGRSAGPGAVLAMRKTWPPSDST